MKQKNETENRIIKFQEELIELVEKYQDLKPYEVANRILINGVTICLTCAPNDLIAFKTIWAGISNGIVEYEDLKKI